MPSTDTARARNRYCERLGLACPDLDAAIRFPQVTLKDLMVLALLEAGEAQPLDAVASRLACLALPPRLARAGDPASLLKAWHGQPPLVRDPLDGLFYLDLLSHHDVRLVAFIGDRSSSGAGQESHEFRQPPDDVPLSLEEVEAAFKGRPLGAYLVDSEGRRDPRRLGRRAGTAGRGQPAARRARRTLVRRRGAGRQELAVRPGAPVPRRGGPLRPRLARHGRLSSRHPQDGAHRAPGARSKPDVADGARGAPDGARGRGGTRRGGGPSRTSCARARRDGGRDASGRR